MATILFTIIAGLMVISLVVSGGIAIVWIILGYRTEWIRRIGYLSTQTLLFSCLVMFGMLVILLSGRTM